MSGNLPVPYRDQSKSEVGRDQIGGDKIDKIDAYQVTIYGAGERASVVDKLLAELQREMRESEHCVELIKKLQRYHGGIAVDGIRGLEAKLKHAERSAEIPFAQDSKEHFAMLLEKWSHYASAQKIFVYLLARAEQKFNSEILPAIKSESESEVNKRFNDLIVDPTVAECGATIFDIDHVTAMGMVYWLAEQCFVRWH